MLTRHDHGGGFPTVHLRIEMRLRRIRWYRLKHPKMGEGAAPTAKYVLLHDDGHNNLEIGRFAGTSTGPVQGAWAILLAGILGQDKQANEARERQGNFGVHLRRARAGRPRRPAGVVSGHCWSMGELLGQSA
jgi:hypothetical protein